MPKGNRRTKEQVAFDYAKIGWAFCNKRSLGMKIHHLEELAKELSPKDGRHYTLHYIKAVYEEMNAPRK